jgi:AcrR family transcriptional regulator
VDRPVIDRLLDATLEVAADHGLQRLSVADVAKRAGLSRQTLYKHVGSKDELVARAVQREAERLMAVVVAAAETADDDDPLGSLRAAIVTMLDVVRTHPLLDRLLATEPEALLPLLVDGEGSVLGEVHVVIRTMIADRMPSLSAAQVEAGADLLSRMLISYAVRSPELDPDSVATFLSHAVLAAVLAPIAPATP